MEEEKINQMEGLLQFVTLLETEGEEGLTSIVAETQTLQEKLRTIEFTLKDKKNTLNDNLFYFSPVGVLEEKDEDRELQTKKIELQTTLAQLEKKLGEYKFRKGKLEAIRAVLLEKLEQLRQQEEAGQIRSEQEAEQQFATETGKSDIENKIAGQKSEISEENKTVMEEKLENVLSKEDAAGHGEKSVFTDGWRILEMQENLRNRIAADLHDSTVQALTGLVHKTEFCLLLMDTDPVRVRLELQKIIDTIKIIINETRDLIFCLRPMNLNKNNLSASMEAYCLQVQKTRGIEAKVEVSGQEPELLSVWKMTLYRIFQEAVGNVVQHSAASKMKVSLSFEENQAHMMIKDNGKGFDTRALEKAEQREQHHFGISLMKERTVLLNGSFDLKSVLGEGTVIDIIVPYKVRKELLNASD